MKSTDDMAVECAQLVVRMMSEGAPPHVAFKDALYAMTRHARKLESMLHIAARRHAELSADADRMAEVLAVIEYDAGKGPLHKMLRPEGAQ